MSWLDLGTERRSYHSGRWLAPPRKPPSPRPCAQDTGPRRQRVPGRTRARPGARGPPLIPTEPGVPGRGAARGLRPRSPRAARSRGHRAQSVRSRTVPGPHPRLSGGNRGQGSPTCALLELRTSAAPGGPQNTQDPPGKTAPGSTAARGPSPCACALGRACAVGRGRRRSECPPGRKMAAGSRGGACGADTEAEPSRCRAKVIGFLPGGLPFSSPYNPAFPFPACVPKSLQSCLTLCDPMDCSPPGSSVHGIFQEGILEWVASIPPETIPHSGIKPHPHPFPGGSLRLVGHRASKGFGGPWRVGTFHTVHGVLKARLLKRFTIPFSRGSRFVRTLHHDPSVHIGWPYMA